MLSDPDILNRLLVCLLDRGPSESPLEERRDSDREDASSSTLVEDKEVWVTLAHLLPPSSNEYYLDILLIGFGTYYIFYRSKEQERESASEEIKAKKKGVVFIFCCIVLYMQ